MSGLDLLVANLLSPMLLCFALGVAARLLKSDLAIPEPISKTLSLFLMLAIGLKGGAALAETQLSTVLPAILIALVLGAAIPLWSYPVLRRLGRFSSVDAASIAAHYGSTSAVTFLACLTFLDAAKTPTEGWMPGLVAVMEVPGILVALLLARSPGGERKPLMPALGHLLTGSSMLLLIGGMAIGLSAEKEGMTSIQAFFVDPFRGVLCLFLLDLGMTAAERLRSLRGRMGFLLLFAVAAPLVHGSLGVLAGWAVGLSAGGCTVLGVLAGSASYIAAPAAVRLSLPTADPAPAIAAALGITFPLNLTMGIPLLHNLAQLLPRGIS